MPAPVLQVLASLAWVAAIVFVAAERRIVRTLRSTGATSESAAVPLPRLLLLARWRLRVLEASGAVKLAGSGLRYLDEGVYREYRNGRRRRAVGILAALGAAALAVYLFSR